jgi:uncharacterized membrane-anchored protein
MRLSSGAGILIAAALAIVGMIGLVAHEGWARANGKEVLLAMETADPRSLLSGDFVQIELREGVPANAACPPGVDPIGSFPYPKGPPVRWIALAPRDGHYAAVGAAQSRAAAARYGALLVRGKADCEPPQPAQEGQAAQSGWLDLDLGDSRFYADEAEVKQINDVLDERRVGAGDAVEAIMSIGDDGRARLKGLMVKGRRIELSFL